jgi:hypothetical protein
LPYLDPREARRSWPLAAVAASALVLSFATVFAGAVLCHVRALRSLLRREDRVSGNARAAVAAALAWDGFAVLLYVVRLRHQSPAWLVDYWRKQYSFPTYAPSLAHGIDAHWLVPAMQRAFDTWLGYGWWRLAALSGLGIVALLLQPRRRWQGLFFAIFFLCPPIAGLLLLFPFGGGRTDYSYQPLLAALGAVGIGALARVLAAPLARLGRAGQIGARLRTAIPLVAIVICLVVRPVPATQYGGLRDPVTSEVRDLVATLDEIARPDDLVLLTPYSLWNVAYYTRLPMEIDFSRPDAKLFLVNLIRPRSLHVGRPRAALASSGVPDRVILVSLYTLPPVMPMYEQDFEQASYERTFEKSIYYKGSKTSTVQVWTRRRTADGS